MPVKVFVSVIVIQTCTLNTRADGNVTGQTHEESGGKQDPLSHMLATTGVTKIQVL